MSGPGRRRTVVAWSTFAIATAMAIVAGALWVVNERSADGVFPPQIFVVPGFGLVGAIITSRSRNVIGPLFLALALVGAGTALTFEYAVRALGTDPGSLPFGGYAGALSNAGFPFTWLALGLTLLVFPDGHLPSRRWRSLAWVFTIVWSLGTVLSLFVPKLELAGFTVSNPVGIGGPTILVDFDRAPVVAAPWNILGFLLLLAVASAPIFRRRRAEPEMRQQLRWFALVLEAILALIVIWAALAILHADLPSAVVATAVLILVALGIPAAIGVAVMKYRLYELDVVINKTVLYVGLAGFITVVYVAIVVGIGSLVGSGDQANVPLSIAATAIVAVAFQPVREHVQRFANRLVYGQRATPYEVLSEFSERIGDAYDVEDLLPRMARILAEGTGAQRSDVWLVVGGRLRPDASWPATPLRSARFRSTRSPSIWSRYVIRMNCSARSRWRSVPANRSPRPSSPWWNTSRARRASCSATCTSPRSCSLASMSCRRRDSAWSPPRTRSGASSSATCTTGRSSSSSPSA